MFTVGTIWVLTHGHVSRWVNPPSEKQRRFEKAWEPGIFGDGLNKRVRGPSPLARSSMFAQ